MASEFVQSRSPKRLFRRRLALGRRLDHDQHSVFIVIRAGLGDDAGDGSVNIMSEYAWSVPDLSKFTQIDLGFRSVLFALSESSPTGSGIPSARGEGVLFSMQAKCRLADLLEQHPRLLWDTAILATQAVLLDRFQDRPHRISLDVRNAPGFGSGEMVLSIDNAGMDDGRLARLRRTYQPTPFDAAKKAQQSQAKQGPADSAKALFKDTADAAAAILRRLRQVELASIAIAGLALHNAGNHEIRDVAFRGSTTDYLVGEEGYLLEVANGWRRTDFAAAWGQEWDRLREQVGSGFFLCMVEFETPAGRLWFNS
jgi:hypothetical protein